MVTGLDYYDPKITAESLSELTIFLKTVNETMGYFPIVIGGWAVYYHTHQQMSQDIDVVMPDEESYYKFIQDNYFRNRGFDDWGKGSEFQHFGKPTTDSNGKPTTIRLDVMFGNKSQKIQNLEIEKDWRLVNKNQEKVTFENCQMYIPTPPLLTTLKIIGALEREEDLKYESNGELRTYFQSKIKKDYLDIAGLVKACNLEKDPLKDFFAKTKVEKHIPKFLLGYDRENYSDIFTTVDITPNKVKETLTV